MTRQGDLMPVLGSGIISALLGLILIKAVTASKLNDEKLCFQHSRFPPSKDHFAVMLYLPWMSDTTKDY